NDILSSSQQSEATTPLIVFSLLKSLMEHQGQGCYFSNEYSLDVRTQGRGPAEPLLRSQYETSNFLRYCHHRRQLCLRRQRLGRHEVGFRDRIPCLQLPFQEQ